MSEVLTAERWREGRLEPCTAVSVRKGKYQHSVKYKHPNAYAMVDTNWRMGVDPASYTTTTKEATREVWGANLTSLMPRIHKNASNDLFSGYAPYNGKQHFATVTRLEHRSTVHDPSYRQAHPAPGFDRLTANKTNYALGAEKPALEVTTSTSHSQFTKPGHVEQPNVGGWHTKDGRYFNDVDVRESMKRGSQGSGGILGYGFNIITGKDDRPGGDPHATLRPRDPRVTRNVTERTDQQVDAWGDAGRRRPDLISGRFRPTVDPPPPFDPRTVKRPDEPVLRSRPW